MNLQGFNLLFYLFLGVVRPVCYIYNVENTFKNIAIIGTGNVAYHLSTELYRKNLPIKTIVQRNTSKKEDWIPAEIEVLPSVDQLSSEVDLVIICVTDQSIASVLIELPDSFPAAYTSGSIRLSQLPSRKDLGVFYPLQTFTKYKEVDFTDLPFLIESENKSFENALLNLAQQVSSNVKLASSEERFYTHVAAVFVNNFTNHLYEIAFDFLKEKQLSFSLLRPLIQETAHNVLDSFPKDVQTGPASRRDQAVMDKHLSVLSGYEKEIYSLMSKSIMEKMKKNEF